MSFNALTLGCSCKSFPLKKNPKNGREPRRDPRLCLWKLTLGGRIPFPESEPIFSPLYTFPQFHPIIANTELFIHALKTQTIRHRISFILPGRMKTKHLLDIENKFLVYQSKPRPQICSFSCIPHCFPDNTCAPHPAPNPNYFLCLKVALQHILCFGETEQNKSIASHFL